MYVATVASRPKAVDGAAPNHVHLWCVHEIGCDHTTYTYDGNATVSRDISGR